MNQNCVYYNIKITWELFILLLSNLLIKVATVAITLSSFPFILSMTVRASVLKSACVAGNLFDSEILLNVPNVSEIFFFVLRLNWLTSQLTHACWHEQGMGPQCIWYNLISVIRKMFIVGRPFRRPRFFWGACVIYCIDDTRLTVPHRAKYDNVRIQKRLS